MIKYLYVLVSDEMDYYLEQALMSMTSLKIQMPEAFVTLLVDDITEKTLQGKRKNILELVDELLAVKVDIHFNKKARSRWLKTSMRKHIVGDFLFIDCDTIISEDLTDIQDYNNIDIGAVLDIHVPLQISGMKNYFQKHDKIAGFNSSFVSDKHFNSGVIFCKDSKISHSFFDEWHRFWLAGAESKVIIDQPSFNQVNLNNTIVELNGKWNCQILCGGIAFLAEAKIIHYVTTSVSGRKHPYLLANIDVFEKIKNECLIDDELQKYLMCPKANFSLQTRLELRRVKEILIDVLKKKKRAFFKRKS